MSIDLAWIKAHLRLPPRRIVLWHSIGAVPLGILVAVGAFLSYHYHELAETNRRQVNDSYELLQGVEEMFYSVEAAALAERDFVITADADALTRFRQATAAFQIRLHQITPLVAAEPRQAHALVDINRAVVSQFDQFAQAIDVRTSQGYEGARAVIALQATGVTTDVLRKQVDAFVDAERRLANERIAVERSHDRHVVISSALIAAASLAIRLGVAYWVRRVARLRAGSASAPA